MQNYFNLDGGFLIILINHPDTVVLMESIIVKKYNLGKFAKVFPYVYGARCSLVYSGQNRG